MLRARPPALPWFLAILLATIGWQAFYCHVVTEGKLTGLFFIGSAAARPPEPDDRVYIYPGSLGFDGQIYRITARDPLLLHGYEKLFDDPRHWYRRILLPGLAGALGGSSPAAIDLSILLLTDVDVALGGSLSFASPGPHAPRFSRPPST